MAWPHNAIIYQIYPRSFKDSDGDGIGDIGGIIEKIPYLKSLGIDAVWLSPIYTSPQKDFGYDVSDFRDIDPIFGNLSNFDDLVSKLHEAGIKLIMDFIPNHTSDKHPWFEKSRKDKNNSKRDWYIWADGTDEGPPNNWLSAFGGSAWKLDKNTNQYYYHVFDEHQPDLNWRNAEVASEMFNTMKFWLDRGTDGFRIDAVDYLFEDIKLLDEPLKPDYEPGFGHHTHLKLLHIYTRTQEGSLELLKNMAGILQGYEDKFMATEAIDATLDEVVQMYKTVNWSAYHPFNFSLINLPWLAEENKQYIDLYERSLSDGHIPNYVIGNHDKPRIVSRIGKNQARNAAILLLTLRGNAFIYNGEEIGMRNRKMPAKYATDTYDIHSPGLGLGRNGQRTPMQWGSDKFANFSNASPWLPVAHNYKRINVEFEMEDPTSFLNLYKKLIKLKKENSAILEGAYIPLPAPADNVYAFIRNSGKEQVLVVVNFDRKTKRITLEYNNSEVIINNFMDRPSGEIVDLKNFKLRADEGIVFKITNP